jgi:hypothetical protein
LLLFWLTADVVGIGLSHLAACSVHRKFPTSFQFSGISNGNIVTHTILNIFGDADVPALHRVCDVLAEGDLLQALVFRSEAPAVPVVRIYIFTHMTLADHKDSITLHRSCWAINSTKALSQ